MKALRLEIEGFGPFLAKQTIDFTEFDSEGLFVITGKTGAGKSTILDAITFALYGDVPRYSGTEKSVRSHFCTEEDRTEVSLAFAVGNETYLVRRSPEYDRPKQRGEGVTTQTAEAQLWALRGGAWEALAVKPREVGQEIERIMQLTAAQFLQVILLAQGQFAKFLDADTNERLRLLRSLFGTQRFEAVTSHLREIARERGRAVETADAELDLLIGNAASIAQALAPAAVDRASWLDETDDALRERAAHLAREATQALQAAEAARLALTEARQVEAQRQRLATAREKVTGLESRAEEHATDRQRLDTARRAAPVAGAIQAAQSAQARLALAVEHRDHAVVGVRGSDAAGLVWHADASHASVAELRGRASELASERGSLANALEAEGVLAELEEARHRAAEALDAARAVRDETQRALDALPAKEQDLRQRRDGLAATAARLADLEGAVEREEAATTAHDRIVEAQEVLRAAQENEAVASAKRLGAVDRHNALLQRRLASQAAHLAAELAEGKPCPVCGSTTHPQPAKPTETHVTDEAVEEARIHADRENRSFEAFQARAVEAKEGLAVAQAEAGGRTREQVDAALKAAMAARDAAATAARDKHALETELEGIAAEAERLRALLDRRGSAVEEAQTAATRSAEAAQSAAALVAAARGEFATVAARAAMLDTAAGLVERLATATEAWAEAERAAADASAALDTAAAGTGLGGIDAVRAALLSTVEVEDLDARIAAYESELSGARAVVAELEAVELPAEVADLTALEASAGEADAVAKAAARTATDAESQEAQFARLAEDYRSKAEATARARQRHAVVDTLANTLEGKEPNDRRMRLESFVLAARLEEIVAAANARLTTMSSGQYLLEYDDSSQYRNKQTGLELTIADAHTGRSRSTRSLSGGETFLASLALALGLAETVTAAAGGIQLDTIFIDEGFGSLDEDTLEIAMSTLDDLRDAGRTVGLISHVEAMKEAIPAKLEVTKAPDGSSRVRAHSGIGA